MPSSALHLPLRHVVPLAAALVTLAAACTGGGPGSPLATVRSPGLQRTVLRIEPAGFVLPAPVQRAVAASWNGGLYVAGGLDAGGSSVAGVFSLDPSAGRVAALGSLPQAVHDAAGAVIGDRLIVFGGGSSQSSDAVQAFDLVHHTGSVIGRLPTPLSDVAAAEVGGTVYLVGGYDGRTPQATIWATTDGVRFRRAGALPVGLRYAAVAAAGTSVIVAGGVSAAGPVSTVLRFDPSTGNVSPAGRLPAPVGHAAAFAVGQDVFVVGGENAAGLAVRSVTKVDEAAGTVVGLRPLARPVSDAAATSGDSIGWIVGGWRGAATLTQVLRGTLQPAGAAATSPGPSTAGTGSPAASDSAARPFAGLMVIADRGNNRLLVVDPAGNVVWRYPSRSLPPPPHRFYFPDDAFWVHGGRALLVNEEENDVVIEIAYPSGKVLWSYGHAGVPGSAAGYLHQPDDVYPFPGGGVVVADARNCRILFFGPNGKPTRQIGRTGSCAHGLPATVGYPNGDTPLPNGNLLLSELDGGYVDEVTANGTRMWTLKVPGVPVPSDPQRLADGSFLVVDYERPGRIVRFTRWGTVLWSYGPSSGPGMLDHPSLAAPLPNGLVAVNDDYRHRVLLIDPATNRIVWRYGMTDAAGTGPNHLHFPDGLDLLLPGGIVPLHVDFASALPTPGRP